MILRQALEADRAFVESLRNDPELIAVGLSRRPASEGWFEGVREHLWIIEEGAARVGYAIMAPIVECSIALSKSSRGRGIGTKAIKRLTSFGNSVARIKPGNVASVKAFQKAGFIEAGGDVRVFFKRGEEHK